MTRAAHLRDMAGLLVAAAAAAAIVVLGRGSGTADVVAVAAVVAATTWIVWQDSTDFTIPDGAVAALALVGAASRIVTDAGGLVLPLLDAALAGGALWILREVYYRRRGFDGLGFGDVKLAAAGSLLVGLTGFSVALLASSLAGLAWAATRRTPVVAADASSTDAPAGRRVAFGVLLAPACAILFAAGRLGILPDALAAGG
jgi:prepilin signal peptidase PulO-like enzyme (type II secretory pathway)